MNYEEKIKELTERVEILEEAERKRIRRKRIRIILKLIKWIIIIGLLYYGYTYVNDKYIKPYKDKLDFINEKIDGADLTLDNIKKYFTNETKKST